MKIRFAVSTIPERADACAELVAQFKTEPRIYVDTERTGGSWFNYRMALLDAGSEGEDWLVSVDDDAELCDDFEAQIERALATCPGDFATFYASHPRLPERARKDHASWISTVRVVHGICWAIRPSVAKQAVEMAERIVKPSYYSGDQRLQMWLVASGANNLISAPSLVNHRTDLHSIIRKGRHNAERSAAWFVKDASGVEWNKNVSVDDDHSIERTIGTMLERGALREETSSLWSWRIPQDPGQPRIQTVPPETPRVSFAISTVPSRRAALEDLIVSLDFGARVYCDEKLTGNGWHNYRRALLAAADDSGSDWLVCMDDDARLCGDFATQVTMALAWCPGDLATFYLSDRPVNRPMVARAKTYGACWIGSTRVIHGICFAVRTKLAREVVEIAETIVADRQCGADGRLHVWLLATGRENWIAIPNLVEQRDDLPSVCMPGRHNSERHKSVNFVADAGLMVWSDNAVRDATPLARPVRRFAKHGILIPGTADLLA